MSATHWLALLVSDVLIGTGATRGWSGCFLWLSDAAALRGGVLP